MLSTHYLDLIIMFLAPMWVVGRSFVLRKPNLSGLVSSLCLIYLGSMLLNIFMMNWSQELYMFQGALRANGGSIVFHVAMKLLFVVTVAVYYHTENKRTPRSLVMTLLTLAFAGYYILVMSDDLMIAGLSIALISISSYGLIVFGEDEHLSYEAAAKYFVLSSVAMAVFLFGVVLIVFHYGSTSFSVITNAITLTSPLAFTGIGFVTIAILFWLGLAPLHFWMPDVYQAAPLPVVSLFASVSKISYLALLLRFMECLDESGRLFLTKILLGAALLSVAWGGLNALTQTRLMRFIANSSIVQLGFMVCTLLSIKGLHVQGAFFYVLSYALTTTGIIIILTFLHRHKVAYETISDLSGINAIVPFLSFFMTLFLLSLAGLPPFIGFFAKIEALRVVLRLTNMLPAIILYLGMLLSLGYYLKVINIIYFGKSDAHAKVPSLERVRSSSLLTMVLVIGAIVFGYLFIAEVIHRPFEAALLPTL